MLLLLHGYGVPGVVVPLVTGRQNYAIYKFRDKRVKLKYRKKISNPSFRDKRKDYA